MIDFTAQQQQTRYFLNLLANYTKATKATIDLHLIQHEALIDRSLGKKLVLASNVDIASAYRILKQENAYWKNRIKLENVYWSWSKEQQQYNIAFVDDIVNINAFINKKHLCLLQTSSQKYQALFLLNEYTNADNIMRIQKTLQVVYGGDKAAVGTYQLHRLAGFVNTKHGDNFIVKTIYTGTNKLNVSDVLEYYYKNIEPQQPKIKPQKPQLQIISSSKPNATDTDTAPKKTWQDFNTDNDNSSTDFRYALYLLHFYSPEQVYDILLNESPDLIARKGAYVGDYLRRTITRALEYFTPSNNSSTK